MPATAQHIPAQPALFFPFRWTSAERAVWKAKEDLKISEFAEKHIHVPRGAHVGPYRNELNPWGVDIMDTWQLPHVREVNVCAPPQATKTITGHCCIGQTVVYDPCEMMLIMPSRDDAREEMDDRIIPMLQQSPELAKHLSDNPDDTSKYHVKFNNGAIIYTAWANSPSKLARKAIKKLFFDEIDKYPDFVGKETNPFNLGEKRKRTFKHTYKIYRSSTPTLETGPIWRFLNGSDVIKAWLVYCPDCGGAQIMHRKKGLRYPADKTPEEILQGKLGRYECEHCHSLWTDTKRDFATRCGQYVITKGEKVLYPRSVGYHLNGCAITDISLSEIAAKEIQAKTDPAAAIDLANDYDSEPYIADKSDRKEDAILRLIDPHMPRGIVPRGINSILIFADAQKIGAHYEVVAFGWGREQETWIIEHGYVEHENHLNLIADRDWFDADGTRYRARVGFIDSGGGTDPHHPKHSRTREIYDFCIDNPFWHPLKGKQRQTIPINWTRLDFFPGKEGKKVAIPGGLLLYTLDTTYYKNTLARKLQIDPGNPGACHLHCGLTTAELESWSGPHSALEEGLKRWNDYAKQMCVEVQNERGFWENPKKLPNHHWDLGVYRYAAADLLYIGDEKQEEPPPPETKKQEANQHKSRRW
jgi:phage terminase large subunit GpA-like protein